MLDRDIAAVFNTCFATAERTVLLGGADEPLYLPATTSTPAQLFYREDFAASALHEAAHWCIAGRARRRLLDFGYAYIPPPRSVEQQAKFFSAELKTQSLESLFAAAAGLAFKPSADNLQADLQDFANRVAAHQPLVKQWLESSSDRRAAIFRAALYKARQQQSATWTG